MSDEQQPSTDEVWVNRLAHRLGIEVAQNERLMIENEMLRQQLQALQVPPTLNGARHDHSDAYEGVAPV
jgi:regulator of replication initiation timing